MHDNAGAAERFRAKNAERLREERLIRYHANPEKERELQRNRRAANPEKTLEQDRKYKLANAEKIRKAALARYHAKGGSGRERQRELYHANIENAREAAAERRVTQKARDPDGAKLNANRRIYTKEKRKDPIFRLRRNLGARLRSAIKAALAGRKSISAGVALGCTMADFILHLERQFAPGMRWDNYGKVWNVDHIEPLSAVDLSNTEECRRACHYSNLRPLTVSENCRKGGVRRPRKPPP